MCRKKGILHLIVPREQFELVAGVGELETYRFNTGVAQHHFCRSCGIHSFYVPRSDPDQIDVNVRCLDGVDVDTLRIFRFDGEHWEQSMQQRPPWRLSGPLDSSGEETPPAHTRVRARGIAGPRRFGA